MHTQESRKEVGGGISTTVQLQGYLSENAVIRSAVADICICLVYM